MPSILTRVIDRFRSEPWVHVGAMAERVAERRGHPVEPDHHAYIHEALEWLIRAQDATPDPGFSRGAALIWHPYFRVKGWQPSYPETTGYIIPTFYGAARLYDRPELAERATAAARWESEIQLASGAVRGGVLGEKESPAVFNTGQVLFGWLAALEETGDPIFEASARGAAGWLADLVDDEGRVRAGNSRFANPETTLYNARTFWALAEAGHRLGEPRWTDASARALHHVAGRQAPNGWLPDCCLFDAERPLLHTLAYATRGLLEGGRVLEDDRLLGAADRAAAGLADTVRSDGWMPGQIGSDWTPASSWSCLTGNAQMVSVWIRLHGLTGADHWLEPVPRVLEFLKATQNRTSRAPGLRGGIKGSYPLTGLYGRYELLNWATKFYVDALVRHAELQTGRADGVWRLA